jgi:glycosyltransferase involved in cell wall biosynthesis
MASIPRVPMAANGELWGISAYFNPVGYQNKIENAKLFSERVRSQGLKLLIVEVASEEGAFALDGRVADRMIRVKSSAVLWQKERLLNIALDHLPDACDKVAWLDADILFENPQWVAETSRLLNEYVAVQPYDIAWWLPHGLRHCPPDSSADSLELATRGLAYINTLAPETREEIGHIGFAWAMRRSVLQKHRFYDRLILGYGDFAMCWAMYGDQLGSSASKFVNDLPQPLIDDLTRWKNECYEEIRGSVFFCGGRVFHLWHGKFKDRKYSERLKILKAAEFNPNQDIALDENLCWRWNTDKPDLHREVRGYFRTRQEDQRISAVA